MYEIKSKTGYKARIEEEVDLEIFNPRNDDNFGHMICFHRRYFLGDRHEWDLNEFKRFIQHEIEHEHIIALPLYLYDHSGITISTAPFSCPWDSGQVGYIYVTKEEARKNFGWTNITKSRINKIIQYLEDEVKTYDMFLRGDVWWVEIVNPQGEQVDSCGGFFGFDYAKEEAKSMLNWAVNKTSPHYEQLQLLEV